jgi:hypothetical protein
MIKINYKNFILSGLLLAGNYFNVFSQIPDRSTPPSFSPYFEKVIAKNALLEATIVPPLDMKIVEEEAKKGIGLNAFARHLKVDFNLENSGEWKELPNGDRVWRLKLYSAGATCLQPFFGTFYIPEGGKLYTYSDRKNEIYGAFTSEFNRKSNDYLTPFIKGDRIVIEYFEPAQARGKAKIHITELSYGYRNDYYANTDGLVDRTEGEKVNESNPCNININCPEGDEWQVHKRAVAQVTMRFPTSSAVCSGALVNNTNLDQSPLFLMAWHCFGGDNTTQWNNWTFRFNYEALGCSNPTTAPVGNTITGCTNLATASNSDFLLLRLTATPAQLQAVNPYFAGWDRSGTTPTQVFGIHHPAGDIKKYSENTNTVTNPVTTNSSPNTFGGGSQPLVLDAQALWQFRWTKGWMEGGSSGSPLFDQNKRLIGTLTGGTSGVANCNNSIRVNSYGRFFTHWTNNSIVRQTLDPLGTNPVTLNGLDPNNNIPVNVGVTRIDVPADPCSYSANTIVNFRVVNVGTQPQSNIPVTWTVERLSNDGSSVLATSSGNLTVAAGGLASLANATFSFTANLSNPGSTYRITVRTNQPGDGNTSNDELSGTVTNRLPTLPASNITFSNITSTSMTINFDQGNARNRLVVLKQGSALTPANYPVNGQGYSASQQFGVGDAIGTNAFVVYKGEGNQVTVTDLTPYGTYFVGVFEYDCTPILYLTTAVPTGSVSILSVEDKQLEVNLKVYPNPASEYVQVELNDSRYESAEVSFTNTMGKSIKTHQIKKEGDKIQSKISLQDMPKGMYLMQFNVGKARTYKKIIVN